MKKPYSFDLTVTTTARFTVPAADYEKALDEVKKTLVEIQKDDDGSVWGEAVRTGDEALYHLMKNTQESAEGDVDAAAEVAFHSVIRRGIAQEAKESFNGDGVSKLQTVVTLVGRGVSNAQESAE